MLSQVMYGYSTVRAPLSTTVLYILTQYVCVYTTLYVQPYSSGYLYSHTHRHMYTPQPLLSLERVSTLDGQDSRRPFSKNKNLTYEKSTLQQPPPPSLHISRTSHYRSRSSCCGTLHSNRLPLASPC